MNGIWQNGEFILASTLIARAEKARPANVSTATLIDMIEAWHTAELAEPDQHGLLAEIEQAIAAKQQGLDAVAALIAESYGVAGLHLNGDVATWDELRSGGRYEDWLLAYDAAMTLR